MTTTIITAQTERDGSALISISGGPAQKIKGSSLVDARAKVLTFAIQHAERTDEAVTIESSDPDGNFRVLVHPDGRREPAPEADREPILSTVPDATRPQVAIDQEATAEVVPGTPPAPAPRTDGSTQPSVISTRDRGNDAAAPWPAHRSAALGPAAQRPKRRATTTGEHAQVPNRIGERPSFITAGRAVQPAEQGWQGQLNKLGGRLAPGPSEVAYRDDVSAVAQHWPGLRTIAVANPKGSGNKTPTSICLAAQFALIGGTGVLAWDNNETRGSLPWRVDHTAHEATVLDLLPRVDALLGGDAQFYAEVGRYVHHQAGDKFDALFSDQSVDGAHVVSAQNVEDVYRVAARYYRLTIVDSGNSERAANWRVMIDRADRLVVPCTNVEDTAEAAARMLESLATRDEHSARLAREAVVIVSQRNPGPDANTKRIIGQFEDMGHEVVTIPYDPALVTGVIRHGQLRKATQRAWLSAAAAAARGL